MFNLKKMVRRLLGRSPVVIDESIFQELTYGEYLKEPDRLDEYLCNLYTPSHHIKFFSFRKFFKLPRTFKFYMETMKAFYSDFEIGVGDTVIDVGGHHGIFTINAAALGADVYCFEPNPMSFKIIERNIAANEFRMEPILSNKAVSARGGETVAFDTGVRSTAGSVEKLKNGSLRSGNLISVETEGFATILGGFEDKQIKMLKMDCEGAEHSILNSIESLENVAYMIVEAHETVDRTPADVIRRIQDLGFVVKQVAANHGAVELYCKSRSGKGL